VVDSFRRLEILAASDFNAADAWEVLGRVGRVTSIGGGPGNDLLGVWLLMRRLGAVPERMVSLDFAASHWREVFDAFEESLREETAQDGGGGGGPLSLSLDHCDISQSLSAQQNDAVRTEIESGCDLFLFSYVLTETRGQWTEVNEKSRGEDVKI